MEALIFGLALLLAGLVLFGLFARGVWLRRVLARRGVSTRGWVSRVSRRREGTTSTVHYQTADGRVQQVHFPYRVAGEGTETDVVYDPEDPRRAVVHIARYSHCIWLALATPLLVFAGLALRDALAG